MTTKEYRNLARRLAVRGIEAYKQRLIYEEDLFSGEDKRHILEQIDVIKDSIKFDKVAELERELAKERKKSKDLQARLDWLHSLNDCDEEFENEEEWKKAIRLSKEELIEWLNEMYKDEEVNREIIKQYEENYGVGTEKIERAIYDPKTMEQKVEFYTKIKAKNFEYFRNW